MNENPFLGALEWLSDPARWTGPSGIPLRTAEHLGYTALGVLVAALIAVPDVALTTGGSIRFTATMLVSELTTTSLNALDSESRSPTMLRVSVP